MSIRTLKIMIAIVALALALPSLAAAQGHFDFYGGYRFSGEDNVDDAFVGGIRAGFGIGPHASLDFNGGWSDFSAIFPGTRIDGNLYIFDASFMVSPGGRPFYLLAGMGGADADIRVRGPIGSYFLWETSFTLNAGLGFKARLGDSPTYLRPEFRVRWYEKPSVFDYELTIGFGFGQ